jgi:hypothetical protein
LAIDAGGAGGRREAEKSGTARAKCGEIAGLIFVLRDPLVRLAHEAPGNS